MKKTPFFRKLLVPILVLTFVEIIIFTGCVLGRGLIQELEKNEIEVLKEKVISRKGNIENLMLHSWMNVEGTVNQVNDCAQEEIENNGLSIRDICEGTSESSQFLETITPYLIEMMQVNRVTGAYVILNLDDLSQDLQDGQYKSKQGVYLRNNDPTASILVSSQNMLMERSPIAVVQKLGIAMDASWDVNFDFANKDLCYYDFFVRPFQAAYENDGRYSWRDLGCWSESFRLYGETKDAITYSVPLILEDGTVYGVLGIDITEDYFKSYLPIRELSGYGTYFLGLYGGKKGEFQTIFGNSSDRWMTEENGMMYVDTDDYYLYTEPLELYENNTPFANERWQLAGMASYSMLYGFVRHLEIGLAISVILSMAVGVLGSLFLSYRLQLPISRLVRELRESDPNEYVHLQETGIREIDSLATEVEMLSGKVLESGKKFSTILKMSSTWIAGFQIDKKEGNLFLTDHFFTIFGMPDMQAKDLTVEQFEKSLKELDGYRVKGGLAIDGTLYQIVRNGKTRFVRVKIMEEGSNIYGLAEDVTQALFEKKILTYERDHDSLTNLYNRRAYRRILRELFDEYTQEIGTALFVMLDLDNLKYVNDTYGHEYGDQYIMQAAAALKSGVGENACYARISGDEFNAFLYGFDTKEQALEQLGRLKSQFDAMAILLPDGSSQRVKVSGGVAWYPQDSNVMDELSKYADYAMYDAKETQKGSICFFDRARYVSQNFRLKTSEALTRLIERREIHYVFQPIVDARTGEVFGYEALMRPEAREFASVVDVLEAARMEGKLDQIEALTWMTAMDYFDQLVKNGEVDPTCQIFINSIPNRRMSEQLEMKFERKYSRYISNIVMELTEDEQLEGTVWDEKLRRVKDTGIKIALDDFGTGYNGEKALLNVSPDFIKADIELVRDIHVNEDKQTMMQYFINYAHGRGKYVIAEGVETREEMEKVIQLGVDYLQGYYLAKPAIRPVRMSEEQIREIRDFACRA